MPDTYSALSEYLQAELEQFCADFVRDRTEQLRRRKAVASGDLAKSLAYEVRAQALTAGVQALIAFEESGRFIDMRRLQPPEGGADYIANIIRWIQAKGLAEKMTAKYVAQRNLKKTPERVLTYIAFGIARKRFSGKYRRTRWYNKAKTATISNLYDNILSDMPALVVEELKKGFIPSSTRSAGTARVRTSGRNLLVDYAKAQGRE